MTVFDNSQVRQIQIWAPFEYCGFYDSAQYAERAVIFGLYSNSYKNNDVFLQGISEIALTQMLADFDSKMAELTTDQQKTVIDITAKRYVTSIESLMHEEKMATELKKINAEATEWDAKIAALSTDRAALETLRAKISAETRRINARITEIQAYIQVEAANLALIDVDIAEKEILLANKNLQLVSKALDEAKKDLAILNVANDIAKVQLLIVNAGLELVEIDTRVARIEAEMAQTDSQIAKLGLVESELEVAIARTQAEEADLEVYDIKVQLAEAQTDLVNKEITAVEADIEGEQEIGQARVDESEAYLLERLQNIEQAAERALFNAQEREVSAGLEKTITVKSNTAQATMDLDRIRDKLAHVSAARLDTYAAIEAARILASATISSELTHYIRKNT